MLLQTNENLPFCCQPRNNQIENQMRQGKGYFLMIKVSQIHQILKEQFKPFCSKS